VFALGGPEAIAAAMQGGSTLAFTLGGGLTLALLVLGIALLVLTLRNRTGSRLPVRLHLALVGGGAFLTGAILSAWHLPFPLHG
jgi:hypothetical protein